MADPKKASVRQAYKEFAERVTEQEFGKLNDKQRSFALARFYVSEVHNPLRYLISEDDFERGWVDGRDDLDIDFVHRDDNHVLVIQCRYGSPGSQTESADISRFLSVFQRASSGDFKPNSKLADAIEEWDLESDTFVFKYITLSKIDGQAKTQSHQLPVLPSGPADLAERVSFDFSDETDLTSELRQALSAKAGKIPDRCSLVAHGARGKRSPIIAVESAGHPSYTMVVSANQLTNIYDEHREGLFSLNIRNYLGNTKTNKSIVSTAKERPEVFFHLNNGISCIGSKVEIDGDKAQVDGFQVINGAQTVKSLYRARRAWKPDEEPLVLVRITEISAGYGEAGRFRNDVVQANNTQNVIKISDFRSNDAIQGDLRRRFAAYARFGKQVDYLPKRTDTTKPNSTQVRLEEFAKAVFSFLRDPVSFSGSTSFLFDDSEKGGYPVVFGDGKVVWEQMPEAEFRLRSSIWWLSEEFSERLRKDRHETADPVDKAAQERKWWLIFASRLVLERSFGVRFHEVLAQHYKGDWRLGDGQTGKWFEDLYDKARRSVIYKYGEAAAQSGFVHRNWMRNTKSVDSLSHFVLKGPIEPLPTITGAK